MLKQTQYGYESAHTKLIWLLDPTTRMMSHKEAKEYCKKLPGGWRLPSSIELLFLAQSTTLPLLAGGTSCFWARKNHAVSLRTQSILRHPYHECRVWPCKDM